MTDKQLQNLGIEGYKEMEAMFKKYEMDPMDQPSVLTVIAVDNHIFMASSQKGGAVIGSEDEVSKQLDECQRSGNVPTNDHRYGRRCGEVMAFDKYYKGGLDKARLNSKDARVAAIRNQPDATGQRSGKYRIVPPCGPTKKEPDIWGCNRLVAAMSVLDQKAVNKDKSTAEFDWKSMVEKGELAIKKTVPSKKPPNDPEHKDEPGKTDQGNDPPADPKDKPPKKDQGDDPSADPEDNPPKTDQGHDPPADPPAETDEEEEDPRCKGGYRGTPADRGRDARRHKPPGTHWRARNCRSKSAPP
ncbi:hypothetical protein CDD83_1064 [Cordyceps sp. RAO-2017]|nr:hypothetical protein CDD83_1064 [Cordyceps sp. RAO-2017]